MSANNGSAVLEVELPSTLPPVVSVNINDATITASPQLSKAGNIWYEARVEGEIADDKSIEQALLEAMVMFDGEAVPPASRNVDENGRRIVRVSEPQKYRKGHAKEGQTVPNTGGNQTITFYRTLPHFGDAPGYVLRVTLTGIEKNGKNVVRISIACQKALAGRAARTVGHVSGTLSF